MLKLGKGLEPENFSQFPFTRDLTLISIRNQLVRWIANNLRLKFISLEIWYTSAFVDDVELHKASRSIVKVFLTSSTNRS